MRPNIVSVELVVAPCDQVDFLAALILEHVAGLNLTDSVSVTIGDPGFNLTFRATTRGFFDVETAHHAVNAAAWNAVARFVGALPAGEAVMP